MHDLKFVDYMSVLSVYHFKGIDDNNVKNQKETV